MSNPFLDRNKVKTHGLKAEKRTATRMGTKPRAGSGSIEGYKGDIELAEFLVENKCTEHKSISLKYDWLEKISKEALAETKEPALAIQFCDLNGVPRSEMGTWVMIPERVFRELFNE